MTGSIEMPVCAYSARRDRKCLKVRWRPEKNTPRIASSVCQLLLLAMILITANSRAACAQTPSPLQEWQHSGGVILARLFEPNLSQGRNVLGLASEVQPVGSGGARLSPHGRSRRAQLQS
jgi:hypothetical protein